MILTSIGSTSKNHGHEQAKHFIERIQQIYK